jgi:hypothetical protein
MEAFMYPHLHKYRFECEEKNIHKHRLVGYTDNMLGISSLHFHYFSGISSYNSHTHYYSGFTGLPIKTENGHKHTIEGLLELNNLHEHHFLNFTFEDTANIAKRLAGEAYI